MPLPVIPALFRELALERKESGVTQKQLADLAGVGLRTIERWEQLENLPLKADGDDPGGDLARAVDVYGEVTPKSPFELWSAAIRRAEAEKTSYEEWLGTAKPRQPHPMRRPSTRSEQAVTAVRRQQKP